MTTRSSLVALLIEAGVEFIELRSRVLIDISTVNLTNIKKFHDLALVFLAHKFSDPKADDHFNPLEAHGEILHYPIVETSNGVFNNLKSYTR